MNASDTLNSALRRTKAAMSLRPPQSAALSELAFFFQSGGVRLRKMSGAELIGVFNEQEPRFAFEGGCPELTVDLATGVGKTRLIGAFMAYLFLGDQSRNFLILSPRTQIVKKFIDELKPVHRKFIFVDPALVGAPNIITPESLEAFSPDQIELWDGPAIWVATPQAFASRRSRLKVKSERTGTSATDYLKSLDDLVVFIDESHHLGNEAAEEESVWRREVRQLSPKLVIGTTATVAVGQQKNVLYRYTLAEALREGLYTKQVKVIVQKRDSSLEDEEHDKIVVRYALERATVKAHELERYAQERELKNKVKPVVLVCCQTVSHAEAVTEWLKTQLESPDEVLLVHSQLDSEIYSERLANLERSDSKIRVVVNVMMLSEGWDVSNVFVVAPLRAMASPTMITQIIGRGLRLPFGARTHETEIDTLDVLCFGKDSMVQVTDSLISQGFGVGPKNGLVVQEDVTATQGSVVNRETVEITLKLVKGAPTALELPNFKVSVAPIDLQKVRIPAISATQLSAVYLHDPTSVFSVRSGSAYQRGSFRSAVSDGILRKCPFLSMSLHKESLNSCIDSFLDACAQGGAEVTLSHEVTISHLAAHLKQLHAQQQPAYVLAGSSTIALDACKTRVPADFTKPLLAHTLSDFLTWKAKQASGWLLSGWKRSVFEAVPFDEYNELHIGKIIDRDSGVRWWMRNLPRILTIDTPAGRYSPDFAILLELKDQVHVLLEVKGEIFAADPMGDAILKKEAAEMWCLAVSQASGQRWQHWFILSGDAADCGSLDDIRQCCDIRPEFIGSA